MAEKTVFLFLGTLSNKKILLNPVLEIRKCFFFSVVFRNDRPKWLNLLKELDGIVVAVYV